MGPQKACSVQSRCRLFSSPNWFKLILFLLLAIFPISLFY
jgi:hypothetical protein